MKFRKKPVVIDAVQYDGSHASRQQLDAWLVGSKTPALISDDVLKIITLEGEHLVRPGDWVIRGVAGEAYPCKPEIFAATYEAVEEGTDASIR
jgi:hypothetical protein